MRDAAIRLCVWHGFHCTFANGPWDPQSRAARQEVADGVNEYSGFPPELQVGADHIVMETCRRADDDDRRAGRGVFGHPINPAAIGPAVDEIVRLLEESDV